MKYLSILGKTRKLLLPVLSLLAVFALGSCELTSKDGDWDPMKWEKNSYPRVKEESRNFIRIPAEGGEFVLRCRNYDLWLLSAIVGEHCDHGDVHSVRYYDEEHTSHLETPWCEVTVKGHELHVTVSPNHDGLERYLTVELESGDVFDNIYFRQDSKASTDQ